MPKVSVIVPVYKVEKYLFRCVESIKRQTLSDIEIILVDDGSPDECPRMCDELAGTDSRIKVLHKKNGGPSSARNAGISIATGEYIGYVDSDDYVEADMFEKMYRCAKEYDVDFVMTDYYRVLKDGTHYEYSENIRSGLYTKDNIIHEIYPKLIMREEVDYGPLLSVWRCIYRRNFVTANNLIFDEDIKWSEDCIYSVIMGYKASSFYYLKGFYGYDYCQNDGSITTSYKPDAWKVYCLMNDKLRNYFEDETEYDFSRQLDIHILYFACSVLNHLRYSGYDLTQKYAEYRKVLNDEHFTRAMRGFELPRVNWKLRLHLWMMKHKWIIPLLAISKRGEGRKKA